jgi:hypothetical protein
VLETGQSLTPFGILVIEQNPLLQVGVIDKHVARCKDCHGANARQCRVGLLFHFQSSSMCSLVESSKRSFSRKHKVMDSCRTSRLVSQNVVKKRFHVHGLYRPRGKPSSQPSRYGSMAAEPSIS